MLPFSVIKIHHLTFVRFGLDTASIIYATISNMFNMQHCRRVSGSSSAELLATFCDNILKKGCSEKLSDEAIEDALEKVHLVFSFAAFIKL